MTDEKKKLINRTNKIERMIRGISKMIENDRDVKILLFN